MLFTPVDKKTGKRLTLEIEKLNIPRGRHGPRAYTVTESATGRVFKCRVKRCGLPHCLCDAYILDYTPPQKD